MYATCRTPDCGNTATPILIPDDAGDVACGVCSQPITDLATTPPELSTEVPSWLA